MQVDFRPTSKNTPEEHFAVLNKVGHSLPSPEESSAGSPDAPPGATGGTGAALAGARAEHKSSAPSGKRAGKGVPGAQFEGEGVNASLEAYLARKAARSVPSAKSAKKGADKGRRAAAASAREPLSDDDLDRLGTRLREER